MNEKLQGRVISLATTRALWVEVGPPLPRAGRRRSQPGPEEQKHWGGAGVNPVQPV